jgi:hypothetical protein
MIDREKIIMPERRQDIVFLKILICTRYLPYKLQLIYEKEGVFALQTTPIVE